MRHGRGQVGDDRVDLAGEQRLLGDVGVLEDLRRRRRCPRGRQRGRPRLGAQLEGRQVTDRGGLRDVGARQRDDALAAVVVAVGEVDDLGALRGDRELVDVEVEVLVARLVGLVERRRHPLHLVRREAELVGDGVGDRRLVALAVGRVVVRTTGRRPACRSRRSAGRTSSARRCSPASWRLRPRWRWPTGSPTSGGGLAGRAGRAGLVTGGGAAAVVVLGCAGHQREDGERQDGKTGTQAHGRDRRGRESAGMTRPGRVVLIWSTIDLAISPPLRGLRHIPAPWRLGSGANPAPPAAEPDCTAFQRSGC